MKKNHLVLLLVFIATASFLSLNYSSQNIVDKTANENAIDNSVEADIPVVFPFKIKANQSLYQALRDLKVDSKLILDIANAAKPVFDLSRVAPNTSFNLEYESTSTSEVLKSIKFKISPEEVLVIDNTPTGWQAKKVLEPIETHVITYSGMVISSLWESASSAGMNPDLIVELAEIFAWQVDFAREVRPNDRWRLSVEVKKLRGENIGWGSILSAEYENAGEVFTAVLFQDSGKKLGYFSPKGESLRRMFLKSPLKFGRVSSSFQRKRFHPILKVNRPHLGVDYAASTGTPIRAVGAGSIEKSRWSGGGGNVVVIRHNSTYKTAYKHLSRFAKGIRAGSKVEQGQIIGYVGSTGLSTGPHLHFEFFVNNRYVNPLSQKFPSADPVPQHLIGEFEAKLPTLLALLPSWSELDVSQK